MLGLVALGLTVMMIYTLVKNALVGKQLSKDDEFHESVELIIPITLHSDFYLEPWLQSLTSFKIPADSLKIHLLIDGHNPSIIAWQELRSKLPYVELHPFLTRPDSVNAVPWMIEQIIPRIRSQVVIIGDPELVPTEAAFKSVGKLVLEKDTAYFVLPQTVKRNVLGEAIAVLNPTLALTSVFGFRKFRRNLSHPLMSMAEGWMAMPLATFQKIKFSEFEGKSWKRALALQWEREGKTFILAFGEKHLLRYYPEDLKTQISQMKETWVEIWNQSDKTGLWLYLVTLFLWSFPVLCFFSHPYWSIASVLLLIMYRFFSKIVFQESWTTFFLHPFGCVVWIGTMVWSGISGFKSRNDIEAQRNF